MERKRICNVYGTTVTFPVKIEDNSIKEIKCPGCGAVAPLKVRRRNRNVKGLKQGFVNNSLYLYIHLRKG